MSLRPLFARFPMWLAAMLLAACAAMPGRDPLRVEVLSGLAEGDLVIVEGRDRLREGARLRVSESAPDKFEPMPDTTQPARTSL